MRYLLFNKPYNVLCQFTDKSPNPRTTLKDYISIPSVYPIGRLDLDSEGLLVLTNNGNIQHRLAHRDFAHPRVYLVQVEGIPQTKALDSLKKGVNIKNYHTRPAIVKLLTQEPILPPRERAIRYRKAIPTSWLEITLTEGRNRQVRRMTAAVGYPTLRLVRVAIGIVNHQKLKQPIIPPNSSQEFEQSVTWLTLDDLQPGEFRDLTPTETKALLSC